MNLLARGRPSVLDCMVSSEMDFRSLEPAGLAREKPSVFRLRGEPDGSSSGPSVLDLLGYFVEYAYSREAGRFIEAAWLMSTRPKCMANFNYSTCSACEKQS